MEECPNCYNKYASKKILTCKFCDKYFCSLTCLMQHCSLHSKTNSSNILINTLKKMQAKDTTEHYSFITPGVFIDNYVYDNKYDIKNFSKVFDGFMPIELGTGSYGHVYLVTHNISQKKYALKVINKRKLKQTYGNCDLIHNEIEIHSKLKHPNIIRLYNILETDEEINILLEYAEKGNLYSLIKKENGFSEITAYKYFIQMVNAVYFLHRNNIIHRDIKPENILIGDNDLLKLCDFGWAKELNVNNRNTFCGTLEYMAPEIVGCEKYDCSVDVWSLGILLYELLMGHSPFSSKKEKNIMIKIKLHTLSFDKNKHLSKDCINLIEGLLDMNPLNRYKLRDIFEHPFIISNSKNQEKVVSKRKESLDDSYENFKFLSKKNPKFNENFKNLQKKFGFESKVTFTNELTSSKQLFMPEFQSDKNLISVKKFDLKKIERKESKRLEKLIDNMSNELEKGKKKIDDLNFKKNKQFSFEDFRDGKILSDEHKKRDSLDDSKYKETLYTSNCDNTFENEVFNNSNIKDKNIESITEEDNF